MIRIGLPLVVIGQLMRIAAAVQTGPSFKIDMRKGKKHEQTLVTNGIYRWLRHPSYIGFLFWAIGTQLVLCNVFALLGCAIFVTSSIAGKIRDEERYLTRMYGNDYLKYKARVSLLIPVVGP